MTWLWRLLPERLRHAFRPLAVAVAYGGRRFLCPLCGGRFRRLRPYREGFFIRGAWVDHFTDNAVCPRCESDIRHRFLFTFLAASTGLLSAPLRLLHFAPEVSLRARLERCRNLDYTIADLDLDRYPGATRVDITAIPFPDASFDAVICVHVLEHIEDDRRAIRELLRVVRPGGWAAIAIPVYGETTFEAPGLTAAERERTFGLPDHVRLNGLDFVAKLAEAGFEVAVVTLDDVPGRYVDRSGRSPHVDSDRYLFFCTRPPAAGTAPAPGAGCVTAP